MSNLKPISLLLRALVVAGLYAVAATPARADTEENHWGHCVQWADTGGTWCTCESGPFPSGGFDCQETDDCYRKYYASYCPLT